MKKNAASAFYYTFKLDSQSPCNHARSALLLLCPTFSCTTLVGALALGSSDPQDDSERCSHLLHWVGKPRYVQWCS